MRQDGAFITRFKPETVSIQFITSSAIPHSKWPFREKAAYDAMLSLADAIKHHQDNNNGDRPEPITRCGLNRQSQLAKDLTEVSGLDKKK